MNLDPIAGAPTWSAARERFEAAWRAKHPSTQPPSLFPPHPEDPLWVEADRMMDEALAGVEQALASDAAYRSTLRAPAWTVLPGGIICPNGHHVPTTAAFCPTCGTGPVPPQTRWDADQAAILLGAKAGLAALRAGGY
jgi:hypothetical protein